jgi:hypothetical protein
MAPVTGEAGVPRLLSEAGLSAAQGVPASVAALLSRPFEAMRPVAPAGPQITSAVPLAEAGLRAAAPSVQGPVPTAWRLLRAEEVPPPLPDVVSTMPRAPAPARS